MDVNPTKLRIIIDIYEIENISRQTVRDISSTIDKMFNSFEQGKNTFIECSRNDVSDDKNSETCKDVSPVRYIREVFTIDDVIGRQIRANKDAYVIMLTSYKSLLTTEVINPWTWSRYWYGTHPTVKFVLNTKKAADIRDTAIFHFEKSNMTHNPYLIITDVDESNKEDTLKLFRDTCFSLSKIICISGNLSASDESLYLMVRMIEMILWNERH